MSLSGAAAQVAVDLISDQKDVSRSINATIREVNLLGQAIDTSNDIAVKTWKKAADAAREYLNVSGATHEQQLKLEVAVRKTDDAINKVAGSTAEGTRNMGFFSALVAEGSGHLGEHSLALGRVERELETLSSAMVGVNPIVGLLSTSLLKFGIGSVETVGILAGVSAVAAVYEHLTSSTREATKAQDDLIKKLEEGERVKLAGGVEGETQTAAEDRVKAAQKAIENFNARSDPLAAASSRSEFASVAAGEAGANAAAKKKQLEKLNDDLRIAIANRDEINQKSGETQIRSYTSDLAALISHNQATHDERLIALDLLKADKEALLTLQRESPTDTAKQAGLGAEIDKLHSALFPKDKEQKGLEGAELAQLHEATRLGQAAIASLDRRMKDDEKARHELDALNVKTLETKAQSMDIAHPAGALSQLAVIKAQHDLRTKEIDDMQIDNDLKRQLQQQADDEELAAVQALNRKIQAENDRHNAQDLTKAAADSKKHAEIVAKRTELIYQAEMTGISAIVSGKKDFGKELLKVTLEPEVRLMEGLAAKQFALGWGDLADHNYAGAALHFKAGVVFGAEGAVIAALAGSGGGGGGGGGSGSGGGGSAAGAQLGTSGGTQNGPLKMEIVIVNKDQTGREVARTRQMIQRLEDRNAPIRVTL